MGKIYKLNELVSLLKREVMQKGDDITPQDGAVLRKNARLTSKGASEIIKS